MIRTRYFGMIAEKLQLQEEEIDFSAIELPVELKSYFTSRYPQLDKAPFVIAVNQVVVTELTSTENINEIVLLPPFAGG